MYTGNPRAGSTSQEERRKHLRRVANRASAHRARTRRQGELVALNEQVEACFICAVGLRLSALVLRVL